MVGEVKFNGKGSYNDFKLRIIELSIGNPIPLIKTVVIPYRNGFYDYSDINGEVIYESRQIRIVFKLPENISTEKMNIKYYQIVNWLQTYKMERLDIDWIKGYFIARVASIDDIEVVKEKGIIAVTLLAQPFRKMDEYEGNDIWDIFNFEEDIAQDVFFDINGSKKIHLVNISACSVAPDIESTSEILIKYRNRDINIKPGINKSILRLYKGENNLELIGNGAC